MILNCGAKRHHYSMFNVGRSMFDVHLLNQPAFSGIQGPVLGASKVRLHRARTRLKQGLDDGCDFYHNEEGTLACDRKPILIESKKMKGNQGT